MKQPPTERERAIAQRRAEGRTLQRIAKEFGGLTPETVRSICRRVEEFDRGAAMLRTNPASIEALGLIGEVNSAANVLGSVVTMVKVSSVSDLSLLLPAIPKTGQRNGLTVRAREVVRLPIILRAGPFEIPPCRHQAAACLPEWLAR